MSIIEANITIDIPDGVNPEPVIAMLQGAISRINGKDTRVNIVQVDDPMSLSPTRSKKWSKEGE